MVFHDYFCLKLGSGWGVLFGPEETLLWWFFVYGYTYHLEFFCLDYDVGKFND